MRNVMKHSIYFSMCHKLLEGYLKTGLDILNILVEQFLIFFQPVKAGATVLGSYMFTARKET